MNIFDPLLM